MSDIRVINIKKSGNRIDYEYNINGECSKYFNLEEKFFVEYDFNVEDIPNGIAIIPFLCNILPISWIFNATITVDEIDSDFYYSIPYIKQGYIDMYLNLEFLGELKYKRIIKYKQKDSNNNVMTLFSGGVDAFYTLLSHISEKPCLSTIWGADIKLSDVNGWEKVKNHIIDISELYILDNSYIKTNFRYIIDEGKLSRDVFDRANDNWWHGFQHGIALLGLNSPIVYKKSIKKLYIASSFTIAEKGKVTCASDPTIDNNVKFCGCKVEHDGYEATRQKKIEFICKYSKENNIKIPLRVCWQSTGGSNCCKCEKCYRTLFGIIAAKGDPRNFGFDYTDEQFKNIVQDLKGRIFVRESNWRYIQESLRKNYKINELDRDIRWLYTKDIRYINKSRYKFMTKVKCKLERIYRVIN